MLALTRRANERVCLILPDGRRVWVKVRPLGNGVVQVGIDAPADVRIWREELLPEFRAESK